MVDYLYDGSFEGLLTCIHFHYYSEKASGIYPRESYQRNMLQGFCDVETDEEKAVIVYDAIEKKISSEALRRIYRVYLSAEEEKETKILCYVRMGFKVGGKINLLHSDPVVLAIQKGEQKVGAEVHRMYGLLRFSAVPLETGGELLYAGIEPDHDIAELLADHFADRYKNESFIIHDKRREKAVFSRGGDWYIGKLTKAEIPDCTEDERFYSGLWKEYFKTMAIQQRINPKCQKRCMPVRYWRNLTEMQ